MCERMTDTDGTVIYPSRSVACKLGIGRNTMIKALRDKRVLGPDNLPVQRNRSLYRAHRNDRGMIATYYTDEAVRYLDDVLRDIPREYPKKYREKDFDDELLALIN